MSPEERIPESDGPSQVEAQARRMAALTLREKLDWLEDAQRLAQRLTGAVAEGPATPTDEPRTRA